ncbi:hypothetical protein [Yersinia enterocolitica]|uniref:hypothetical protein n=1 Tax=Yersinia enterocolitica TaxID=630 RepID=UPI001C60E56F|nr:hypothetical protein [Yersinia enterocolitica]MBW5823247.1 hypothetical protein [Yersinia enterocolitica]MBW5879391.1 hypothetical protein [Yersinia enterocolitica]
MTMLPSIIETDLPAASTTAKRHGQMKKTSKQSKSGWGGRRAGAGAPYGNTNAVKHGERSKRAFFPLEGEEQRSPLVNLRVRNLILAEQLGKMNQSGRWYNSNPQDWRESLLIEGIMWQHTKKMMRLERLAAQTALQEAKANWAKLRNRHNTPSGCVVLP